MRSDLPGAKDGALTSEYATMNIATRRNHMIAARFYALAADARRAALNECVDRIERGDRIPPYCRIDTARARYYAEQARIMRMRGIRVRYARDM